VFYIPSFGFANGSENTHPSRNNAVRRYKPVQRLGRGGQRGESGIACGSCFFCNRTEYSCCDTTNPNAEVARKAMGQSPAGLFGFSHMLGGYAGGQAE
jgi:threonine dehydrogenase-like Zn-dependent dehydrogenase